MTDEDERFFNNLPVGYRFSPTDQELVSYYLMNKILNRHIPFCRIRDQYIYLCHPKDLAEKYELNKRIEDCWYFFTGRMKKYANGGRPDRTTETGYWKPTSTMKEVYINGKKAAEKRTLDYYEKRISDPKNDVRTEWKMHEFVLCHKFTDPLSASTSASNKKITMLDKCVLCKIYNKTYNAEGPRNNNEDAIPAAASDDSNTNQAPNTNNQDHVNVEAITSIAADDSNASQAANTNYEDPAAVGNQTTNNEQISNQAQLVHYPTDPHQWYPQPQAAPANNYYCYPGPGIDNNNNNNNFYCYPQPGPGTNQDVYDTYGQSCIAFRYDEQKPYDHQYRMQSNYWQSLLDQTDYNMSMGSSNQVMPHPVEQLSNPNSMDEGAFDVQPLSSLPYHSRKRTRFGL